MPDADRALLEVCLVHRDPQRLAALGGALSRAGFSGCRLLAGFDPSAPPPDVVLLEVPPKQVHHDGGAGLAAPWLRTGAAVVLSSTAPWRGAPPPGVGACLQRPYPVEDAVVALRQAAAVRRAAPPARPQASGPKKPPPGPPLHLRSGPPSLDLGLGDPGQRRGPGPPQRPRAPQDLPPGPPINLRPGPPSLDLGLGDPAASPAPSLDLGGAAASPVPSLGLGGAAASPALSLDLGLGGPGQRRGPGPPQRPRAPQAPPPELPRKPVSPAGAARRTPARIPEPTLSPELARRWAEAKAHPHDAAVQERFIQAAVASGELEPAATCYRQLLSTTPALPEAEAALRRLGTILSVIALQHARTRDPYGMSIGMKLLLGLFVGAATVLGAWALWIRLH